MAYSSGKVTAPVSIADVKAAVGSSSNDLGTLCQASGINQWAKYKPVRLFQVVDTTDQYDFTNNKWKSTATWWKGLSSEFAGITPPSVSTTISQLIAKYNGSNNGWVYTKPTGNNYPFRLTDFAGYNRNAPAAVQDFYVPSQVVYNGRFTASAMMSMPDANADYISLADFSNLNVSGLYFGIWIVGTDGTPTGTRCTADETGVAGVTVNLENSGNVLSNHTNYRVYPFLSNKRLQITDTSDPTGLQMYPCPNVNYATIYTVSRNETANISVDARYSLSSQTAINVTTVNGDSTAYSNCYIYLMPMTYWNNPGTNTSHAIRTVSSFTLSAGEEKLTAWTGVPEGDYFVYATFNSGTYTRQTNVLGKIPSQ